MIKLQNLPPTFLLLFFFAGASALMFEVLWQRMLILTFGASPYATTAVLTAIFCGIGLGSWLGGKLLHRFSKAVFFYSWTILWVGIWGIAVPFLLKLIDALQLNIFQALHPNEPIFFALRFMMAVLVLLPATLGMGATIPAMNRIVTEYRGTVGTSVSLAYGANTIGSVLGSLLVGFMLIPQWGMRHSLYIAAGIYALVAIGSAWATRGERQTAVKTSGPFPQAKFSSNALLVIYFFSGFLALGYEITWLRLLGIFNSNSIITFTLGLSIYLLGCSIGSLVLYPLLARRFDALRLFILSNWGTGILTLSLVPLYYFFSDINVRFINVVFTVAETSSFHWLAGKEAFLSFAMMFFPTLFMGLAYPAVCELVIKDKKQTDTQSGYIYFLGSLGAAAGTAVTALVLIPSLDLVGTLAFLCSASLGLALITLNLKRKLQKQWKWFFQWSSLAFIFIAVSYGLTGHPFFKSVHLKAHELPLLRYRSGPSATINIQQTENATEVPLKQLFVDDQPVAGTDRQGKTDAKMLAHLPLLLHTHPQRALTVGFGTGGTSWSMTRYGIAVDCVEIEPEVPRSAYLFTEQNYNVFREPNFNLIINDARNFLHLTENRYDVISTDVTNLQYKQNSSLYTKEYFELMKARLTAEGIASAWVPMSSIDDHEFRILLKTFQTVFSHTSVWIVDRSSSGYYAIFIGTPDALEIDYAHLEGMFISPKIKDDLAEIGFIEPADIIFSLLLDENMARNYAGDVPLHTDDFPILEFHSVGSLYSKLVKPNSMIASIPENFLPEIKSISPEKRKALLDILSQQNTQ